MARRPKVFLRRTLIVLAVLGLACALLSMVALALEERLIFFPDRQLTLTPDELGLDHEELSLETSDGQRIHGYFITPSEEREPRAYLLFSHGNGGNVSGRLEIAGELVERGLAVLLYDYRGYGRSSDGPPNEEGVYRDAEAAYAAIVERSGDPGRVILYGRSLGGGVTWELASRHDDVAGVITDCTFTSVPDMAAELFPRPVSLLVQTQMNNLQRVAEVEQPKLLLHGTADKLIPFRMGQELHRAARPPVEFVPLPGAGHNDTFFVDPELYYGAIDEFVERVRASER